MSPTPSDAAPPSARFALVGGGGHALGVGAAGAGALAGYFDDDADAVVGRRLGLRRLGDLRSAGTSGLSLLIAVGDLGHRRRLIEALSGCGFSSLRAASALIVQGATTGPGLFMGPGAVVQAFAAVGAHAIINTGAIVEHECEIGENVHIAPGAVLGGRAAVGADTLIGLGARVLPGVRIGRRCTVGAGAVVIADVSDGVTVSGIPARAH